MDDRSSGMAGNHISYWLDTTPETSYTPLSGEVEVDVAIVGGGMAGLSAAYFLTEAGKRVAVIERGRIATGVTGHTTAKLTSQHGLLYTDLISKLGEDRARQYAEANETAIAQVVRIAEAHHINCDIQRMPAYLYAVDAEGRKQLMEEAESATLANLHAEYTEHVPLPFPVAAAVRFENQGIFHPRKYLLAVAEIVIKNGCHIFERTVAEEIVEKEDGCTVTCSSGVVRARDVVIATNYPIKDPKLFFARLTTRQSYVVAVRLEQKFPLAHFYSTEKNFHSLRPHLAGTDDEIVLVGGEYHPTGQESNVAARYDALETWAREHLPVISVEYSWSTHDAESFDRVPMVGKLSMSSDHLYVATGFKGWGMTNCTAAGMLLRDEILGLENNWSKLYNPSRIKSFFSTEMLAYDVGSVTTLIKGKLSHLPKLTEDMAPGEARKAEIDGEKIAVYKDEEGGCHIISAVCTHMGCIVNWNNAERTWDCPCHGSRFDIDGRVVHAPAVCNLKPHGG